jgi:hypothetical protein
MNLTVNADDVVSSSHSGNCPLCDTYDHYAHSVADCLKSLRSQIEDLKREVRELGER